MTVRDIVTRPVGAVGPGATFADLIDRLLVNDEQGGLRATDTTLRRGPSPDRGRRSWAAVE
jgi:hypothetical protein